MEGREIRQLQTIVEDQRGFDAAIGQKYAAVELR
jgi:hypothetical protein